MSISAVPTFELERRIAADGYDVIVGFDEVGRGSLAGPVMVGAAAFHAADLDRAQQSIPQYLADSKMLTEHRREALYEPLQKWVDAYAIGSATNQEIDEWGITYALGIAALRALDEVERALGLEQEGGVRVGAILDGPSDYISKAFMSFEAPLAPVLPYVVTQVKGDQRCCSVAAAAVLAKVKRDRLMVALAEENPDYARYGWAHNKGYGSQAHREAIVQYGPSDLHRVSWKLT
ncbi:ribonuclease HII [Bifidobacterium anseris]|uniref:Ribonuclease n=1 Tax=Bifidobacterium anseris TaxID=2020963 RepID=A0A2N5IY24_9BIFI|nr:ribonuclease HII [Bifidobacterium anseris]PLS26856.1 ribonuclease HII [Bifidobacterium anseris]